MTKLTASAVVWTTGSHASRFPKHLGIVVRSCGEVAWKCGRPVDKNDSISTNNMKQMEQNDDDDDDDGGGGGGGDDSEEW